jgi:hypothetical protein
MGTDSNLLIDRRQTTIAIDRKTNCHLVTDTETYTVCCNEQRYREIGITTDRERSTSTDYSLIDR